MLLATIYTNNKIYFIVDKKSKIVCILFIHFDKFSGAFLSKSDLKFKFILN